MTASKSNAGNPFRSVVFILVVTISGFVLASSIGGTAEAIPSIAEFTIPTQHSQPQGIAFGPDGNLWFTEYASNKIGKITMSGAVTEYSIPGSDNRPEDITVGPDGNLWFTAAHAMVAKLTTSGAFSVYSTPSPSSETYGITAGPDGNVWFADVWATSNPNEPGRIGKITPSGSITEYTISPGSVPVGITAGPDGNIWFTEQNGNRIGRITPSGSIAEYDLPSPASGPYGITCGHDGNVWFTEKDGNKLGKITPSGSITEYIVPSPGCFPWDITTGRDGSIWFTEYIGDRLGKITPSGSIIEYDMPTPTPTRCPYGITGGPDGNIWFTEQNASRIGRVLINPPVPPANLWKSTFYFAEGYTGPNFQEYATLENPNTASADAWITCMFSDGTNESQYLQLTPASRLTVDINRLVGPGKEVSMRVVSTSPGVVVERPMYFDYNGVWTGGSDAVGATSPANSWYFAEGSTLPDFDEYVTVQNPGGSAANLTFHYMVEGSGEKEASGQVGPHSRATFKTRDQIGSNLNASLFLSSDQNVVAERPMYFDYMGLASNKWTGGHDVVGTNSPAKSWYLAEGSTRSGFEEWLCLQNPNNSPITVSAIYQLGSGQGSPITKSYTIPASQRLTVSVNREIGANKDDSVYLSSTANFIAERPMYFNYQGKWTGGHDVLGANNSAKTWFFAEGTTRDNFNEWLCLQNPGSKEAHATVTYYTASGQAIPKSWTVPANSRLTVNVNTDVGPNQDISAEVTSDEPIIAERPMYFNYSGVWDGGHDVVGFVPQ